MQNLISIAMILLTAATGPAQEKKMTGSPFSITATCRDNPQCIFENEDIIVELSIRNDAPHEVRIPLEFIDQSGPYCALIDNETGKKITLRVGLPDHLKIEDYVIIKTKETVKMVRRISVSNIRATRSEMVDLTAKLTIAGPIQLHPGAEQVRFRNDIDVRIIGKDKINRDGRL
jgi:hypothetical protein